MCYLCDDESHLLDLAGWSSTIQSYDPAELVANLKRKMVGEEMLPMHPWYRGFLVRVSSLKKMNGNSIRE